MTELTTENPTASHPTGNYSTCPRAPSSAHPPYQPQESTVLFFTVKLGVTPPHPLSPNLVPSLSSQKETAAPGTGPSSRCSSVNPNDTLPPTPNCGPAEPYPPPDAAAREYGTNTIDAAVTPGARMQGEQEVRPTTHLPVDDHIGRPATMNIAVPTEYHNALPSRPVQEPSYTAARRSAEVHPSGYKQNSEAMEKPRYYGVQNENENKNENEKDGRGDGNGEETLLGKLGKWMEGLNNKIVETGITGDTKGKGKESQ